MKTLMRNRAVAVAASLIGLLAVLGVAQAVLDRAAEAQSKGAAMAPRFEVDPMWPKPMPNHWVLGQTIGVWVDSDDHVWIVHRGSSTLADNEKGIEKKTAELCCAGAPPVLEFDQAGNLLRHWGGPGQGYEWPDGNHGIFIDYKGNVWIGGNGGPDSHILKFTKDGKFLLQVGKKGARRKAGGAAGNQEGQVAGFVGGSNDQVSFGRVAKIFVDAKAPAQQFYNPVHCADMSNDRFIYVCDRVGDRLQVFTPEGKFVKEAWFAKNTKGSGAVWDIAFSKEPDQKYIYMADGMNDIVRIVDRQTLEELTSFGDGGRQPGQFYGVHSIATDSKGNIYTTETWEGKRLQRFVFKGMAPVTKKNQGVVWPGTNATK